jgi:polysaccharide biosynthesis/export protein
VARLFVFFGIFSLLVSATTAFAAQSTADVSVSAARKGDVLKETLGAKAAQLQHQDEYVIGHGDILTISIFEEGDMAASSVASAGRQQDKPSDATRVAPSDAPRVAESGTRVMMDGRISLRDIGDVEVVGLTLAELANYLKKLYATIYDDPIVTTTLVQSNSLRYTVMGNVTGPGVFFLDYPMTLIQVVARAGGFSEWASRSITVVRKQLKEEDKDQFKGNTLEFDYDGFVTGKSLDKNIFVRSGDIVIVH